MYAIYVTNINTIEYHNDVLYSAIRQSCTSLLLSFSLHSNYLQHKGNVVVVVVIVVVVVVDW